MFEKTKWSILLRFLVCCKLATNSLILWPSEDGKFRTLSPIPNYTPLSPLLLHPSSPPPLFVMRIVVLLCSPIFDWLTDWFKRRRLSIVIRERHKKEVMFKFYCKTDNRRLLFVKPHLKWPNTMNTFKEGRFYVERCNLTSLSFEVLI